MMDDTKFLFVVVPLTVTFVAVLFSMVFRGDFVHWYRAETARRLAGSGQPNFAPTAPVQQNPRPETVSHRREHELVSY